MQNLTNIWRPLTGASWIREGRVGRMAALLVAIVIISIADLYMTLAHATGPGMLEANPIARAIMTNGAPSTLIAWKVLTVGFGVAILIRLRRSAWAEAGAWLCFGLLTWLSFQWLDYNSHIHDLTPYVSTVAEYPDAQWVRMNTSG